MVKKEGPRIPNDWSGIYLVVWEGRPGPEKIDFSSWKWVVPNDISSGFDFVEIRRPILFALLVARILSALRSISVKASMRFSYSDILQRF